MNIGIIGLGAIGGWIGGRLAASGGRVTAFARGATLDALRVQGLLLQENGTEQRVALSVTGRPDEASPPDVLIIATKATALADAAEWARPLIGPGTTILPLQNGVPWWFLPGEPLRSLDPNGRIAAALPAAQVIGGVVHASCRRSGLAAVEVVHADRLVLGEAGGEPSKRVRRLADLFSGAGIRTEASENIRRAIWYKLWGNMTVNPLSALTRSTADRLIGDPLLRPIILAAMAEAAAIGAAIGCPIKESGEERMAVTARLGAFKTSMLQDLEGGRPLELEALVGAPREIARRVEVPTPTIDMIYGLTRQLMDNAAPLSR